MTFDTIIVGGGSAGSVLANRLSARSQNKVLLLEAGRDTPHGKVPAAVLDSYPGMAYLDPNHTWSRLKVTLEVIPHNRPDEKRPPAHTYEQARILGGGSSINGQLANRGAPTDYDEWAARGAAGWDWNSVLPYFKRVERDMDFAGPWHGTEGRIPVRRNFPDLWPEHAKAVAKAFQAAGYRYLQDQNAEWEDGYFPLTISNAYERRVSAAIGYLDPGTRLRDNLSISTDTHVSELMFDGQRCVGVKAVVAGRPQEFCGGQVILSCGAIHSPAHLLRAGIGPVAHLRELGIEVRAALPGVGQRLQDHPGVAIGAFLKPHARMIQHYSRMHMYTGLRYSSNLPGVPPGDMFTIVANKSAWHKVGEQIGSFLIMVYKTYSETGQIRLRSSNWQEEPKVDFNLLSDQRDLQRLMDGVRRFGAMHLTSIMQGVTSHPFPANNTDRVLLAGKPSLTNKILTRALARMLDGPAALRRYLMETLVMEGVSLHDLLADDDKLEAYVRTAEVGVRHASCSCRMGSDDDPMAVADPSGRVRGVDGLRVVDASVFPVVPCANTNFPVLMTAEKMADAILTNA
jgi:5-(hydroxymethyl)furfural/furfural oxidase